MDRYFVGDVSRLTYLCSVVNGLAELSVYWSRESQSLVVFPRGAGALMNPHGDSETPMAPRWLYAALAAAGILGLLLYHQLTRPRSVGNAYGLGGGPV